MTNQFDERIAGIEDRAKRFAAMLSFIAGGILGVLGTVVASYFGYLNRDRELDLELAKLSLSILAGDYKDDANYLPARRFAINALEKGSGVDITDEDKQEWATSGVLPGSFLKGLSVLEGNWTGAAKDKYLTDYPMSQNTVVSSILDAITPNLGQRFCVDENSETYCGSVVSVDSTEFVVCIAGEDGDNHCGLYVSEVFTPGNSLQSR